MPRYLVWDDEGRSREEALAFFVDELQGKSAEYETAARLYGQRTFHDEPFEERRCFVASETDDAPHVVDVFVEIDPEFDAMDMGPEKKPASSGTPTEGKT